MSPRGPLNRFMAELRRRHVPQTAAVYLVAAWAAIQFADVVAPNLNWPQWVVTAVIVAAAVGLPVVLVLAWFLEWGPDGIHRTPDHEAGDAQPRGASRDTTPWVAAVAVLVVAIGAAVGMAALLSGTGQSDASAATGVEIPGIRGTGSQGGGAAGDLRGADRPIPPIPPVLESGELGALTDSAIGAAMQGLDVAGRIGGRSRSGLTVFEPGPWLMGRSARWDPGEPLSISGIAVDSAGVLAVEVDGEVVAEPDQPVPALQFQAELRPRTPVPDSIAIRVRTVHGERTTWYRVVTGRGG